MKAASIIQTKQEGLNNLFPVLNSGLGAKRVNALMMNRQ